MAPEVKGLSEQGLGQQTKDTLALNGLYTATSGQEHCSSDDGGTIENTMVRKPIGKMFPIVFPTLNYALQRQRPNLRTRRTHRGAGEGGDQEIVI
jgi:hypothetical protein